MTKNTISASLSNSRLTDNQIHIWKIDINYPKVDLEYLYKDILSNDEKVRVDRLRSEKDKIRFIVSRGLLRKSLSSYLNAPPSEIAFTYNKYGKPSVNSKYNLENIKFNVSHSKNLAVYAITKNREVGIDLEYIRKVNKADKIVGRFFTEEESEFYYSQPDDKKELAFFTLWTRKEAYSKARGMGIGLPAKEFDLKLIPTLETKTTDVETKNIESRWSLVDIEIDSEYLAALATEGSNIEICHYQFETSL